MITPNLAQVRPLLDRARSAARAAASSPRNDLVKTCRVYPTHWLISTQAATIPRPRPLHRHDALPGHVRHLQRHRVIGIATLTRTAAGVLDDEVDWAAGWISHLILVCALVADRDRVERRLEHLLLLLHLYLSGHDSRTLDQPLRRRKLRTRRNAPGTRRDV